VVAPGSLSTGNLIAVVAGSPAVSAVVNIAIDHQSTATRSSASRTENGSSGCSQRCVCGVVQPYHPRRCEMWSGVSISARAPD